MSYIKAAAGWRASMVGLKVDHITFIVPILPAQRDGRTRRWIVECDCGLVWQVSEEQLRARRIASCLTCYNRHRMDILLSTRRYRYLPKQ